MSLHLSKTALGVSPSVTLHLNAQVALLKSKGIHILSLGAGEPDFDTPAPICTAAIDAIRAGRTRYTDAQGLPKLRQSIAEYIQAQKGLCYAPPEIIVGAGAKQVLFGALQALLNPGDEVLLPVPYWVSYAELIRMAGGVPVFIKTDYENRFLPTAAQLSAAVTPRTKALIINTPNNPTGALWPHTLLKSAVELACQKDFVILSDEIYEGLIFNGHMHISPASLGEDAFKRTIVVSGFSKTFAMTGWRVGYAAGPRHIIDAMSALQSHAAGNCNTIAQHAALAALKDAQSDARAMAQTFQSRRDHLLACLKAQQLFPALIPEGAFYLLLDIRACIGKQFKDERITDDARFSELLLEHAHVAVVPGIAFGLNGYVRLSYTAQQTDITRAVEAMGEFVKTLQ